MYPVGLKYNAEHTWLLQEEGGLGRVGITQFAQEQLKEVVYVDLPEIGTQVSYMEPFGVIESVKATNDLYSPVSGVIVEVNKNLSDDPGLVNQFPYDKGWVVVIKMSDPAEMDRLIPANEYQLLVEGKSAK